MDTNKRSAWLEQVLASIDALTEEELKQYFPESNIPKGWVSIEDHLPECLAIDMLQGGTRYREKNEKDEESESLVGDPTAWYYEAKEAGITHWWNP